MAGSYWTLVDLRVGVELAREPFGVGRLPALLDRAVEVGAALQEEGRIFLMRDYAVLLRSGDAAR